MQTIFVPVGVPTYHLESAKEAFDKSVLTLKSVDCDIIVPDGVLLDLGSLESFLSSKDPDLVIFQNITFANAAYIASVLRRFDCPVLLWNRTEPQGEKPGRLKLNSLTGAFSAANCMYMAERNFEYVYGEDEEALEKIKATISAVKAKEALKKLNLLQVGHTPQGFGFGRALDSELLKLGVNLISIEARELINLAKGYDESEVLPYIKDAKGRVRGLDKIDKKNVVDFARLYKAYFEYVTKNDIGALSSRCWPDFFTDFGTPNCAVLSILNDRGIASSCEADTLGALSMYLASFFTNAPAFFGDPVALDEENNALTFWHCGMGACSLAREDAGAVCGVHCNRKIGPTLEFGVRAQKEVTVFRLGRKQNGELRMLIATGEAPDVPQQYFGTSMVVVLDDAKSFVQKAVESGFEPHYAVATRDIEKELVVLCKLLGLEVINA